MMSLGLSSRALPDAGLDALVAAVARRGLMALELREGDAHGVAAGDPVLRGQAAAQRIAAAGLLLAGFRTRCLSDPAQLACISQGLHAPLVLDCAGEIDGRIHQAKVLAAAGAAVVVVVRGREALREATLVRSAGLELTWDADPAIGGLGDLAEALLACCQRELHQICLLGGGPEAGLHHGAGIGHLMRCLALAGWRGSLILAPSSTRFRPAWSVWLGRRRGWGCGSKSPDAPLLSLTAPRRATQ
jgi:hypothetical protein